MGCESKSGENEGMQLTTLAAAGGLLRRRRGSSSRGTALLASLDGVDLALGELTGADALVGGTVLLEAAVLCGLC